MKLKRSLAGAAGLVLAFSISACGGSDAGSAPDDASEDEFCKVLDDVDGDEDASAEEQAEAANDAADEFADVGTPESISEDGRAGFEVFVDALADVDEDAMKDLEKAESEDQLTEALGTDEDDAKKVLDFLTYAAETCA